MLASPLFRIYLVVDANECSYIISGLNCYLRAHILHE